MVGTLSSQQGLGSSELMICMHLSSEELLNMSSHFMQYCGVKQEVEKVKKLTMTMLIGKND